MRQSMLKKRFHNAQDNCNPNVLQIKKTYPFLIGKVNAVYFNCLELTFITKILDFKSSIAQAQLNKSSNTTYFNMQCRGHVQDNNEGASSSVVTVLCQAPLHSLSYLFCVSFLLLAA